MKGLRTAVVGYGKLGRTCARALLAADDLQLAGFVRRPETVAETRDPAFAAYPAETHVRELQAVDAALICVPNRWAPELALDLLEHGTPIVECAELHGEAFERHKQELDRVARVRKVAAIVGAGWDPGALSLLQGVFQLLTPHGHTVSSRRAGVVLHHTTVARSVHGVRDALATEGEGVDGAPQRYVYLELEPGADETQVERALRADPLFVNTETFVFVVPSIGELEDEEHGLLLQRRGRAAGIDHQSLLFEGRFSKTALSAQMMLTALRALPGCRHRAYSLFDLPLGALFGALRQRAETECM